MSSFLKTISESTVSSSISQLDLESRKKVRRRLSLKRKRKRRKRKKRRKMMIWKLRMKKTRKKINQRLRLLLRSIGIMKYRMKIKLFGLEVQKILKKKNIISFINSLLKTRMILYHILISRLMEVLNSEVFFMFLRHLLTLCMTTTILVRVVISNCM